MATKNCGPKLGIAIRRIKFKERKTIPGVTDMGLIIEGEFTLQENVILIGEYIVPLGDIEWAQRDLRRVKEEGNPEKALAVSSGSTASIPINRR